MTRLPNSTNRFVEREPHDLVVHFVGRVQSKSQVFESKRKARRRADIAKGIERAVVPYHENLLIEAMIRMGDISERDALVRKKVTDVMVKIINDYIRRAFQIS